MRLPPIQSVLSRLVAERNVRVTSGEAYGPHPRHRLDLYEPPVRGRRLAPICLFLYGGSWTSGQRACYSFVGAALAAHGITTAVADYRLFPEVRFPAFVEDAAEAYRWLADHVADAARRPLIVAGHSAGAHTAALLALDGRYLQHARRPDGLIGLSGPYAFDPTRWPTTVDIFATAQTARETRPAAQVTPTAPPALLVHGAADALVKPWNTHELARAYRDAGVPVDVVELPRLGHIDPLLALARPLRWRAPVLQRIVGFAERLSSVVPARSAR